MSSAHKNLSEAEGSRIKSAAAYTFGIVWSEWNYEITSALQKGAYDTLIKYGVKAENIIQRTVPGSYELTLGAQYMAEKTKVDAVICLGCVIQGETKHFDFICN
ncbi:MAG: 6,7-dimethyl-8-ribityllumazine synthase, partial [Bacteroidia bacterium]